MDGPLIVSMKLCFVTSGRKGTYTQSECPVPRILLEESVMRGMGLTETLENGVIQQHEIHTAWSALPTICV